MKFFLLIFAVFAFHCFASGFESQENSLSSYYENSNAGMQFGLRKLYFSAKENFKNSDFTIFFLNIFNVSKPNSEGLINEFGFTYGNNDKDIKSDGIIPILTSYKGFSIYHFMLLKPENEFFGAGFGYGIEHQRLTLNLHTIYEKRKYFSPFVNFRIEAGNKILFFTDFQYSFNSKIKTRSVALGCKFII
jgi:hypothetical protein